MYDIGDYDDKRDVDCGDVGSFALSLCMTITTPIRVPAAKFWASLQTFRFFSPERLEAQFTYYRTWCFAVSLIWAFILWAVIISKTFSESLGGVIKYFTNVSIILQAAYYTADLCTFFADPKRRTLEFYLLYIFYFPMLAQTFAVFIMVMVVFLDNATIVTENLQSAGGEYSDGLVLFIERLYHVIPFIVAMIYGMLRVHDITDFLIMVYGAIYTVPVDTKEDAAVDQCTHARTMFVMRKSHSRVYIFYQYVISAVPFCIYVLIQNVQTVYGIDTFTNWMGVAAVFGLNILSVLVPLDILIFVYIPARPIPPGLLRAHDNVLPMKAPHVTIVRDIPPIQAGHIARDENLLDF